MEERLCGWSRGSSSAPGQSTWASTSYLLTHPDGSWKGVPWPQQPLPLRASALCLRLRMSGLKILFCQMGFFWVNKLRKSDFSECPVHLPCLPNETSQLLVHIQGQESASHLSPGAFPGRMRLRASIFLFLNKLLIW